MGEPSWSLHLLSELLSAFQLEDPDALRTVIHRVSEAVDAEVVAVVTPGHYHNGIGLDDDDAGRLLAASAQRPPEITLSSGSLLHCNWSPMLNNELLVAGRLIQPFDLEERSLLQAMARSLALSKQLLQSVAAERSARRQAEHQATHDSLTGLANRSQVLTRLQEMLGKSHLGGGAVLFIDLDRFKVINDAHGHAVGDGYLVAIAARLRRLAGSSNLVGRLAGDEFVVVIADDANEEAIKELAAQLLTGLSQPVLVQGKPLLGGASLGIAPFSSGATAERLIENADMAMYRAKQIGRGRCCYYDVAMRRAARRRASLEADLRLALSRDQIGCYLQPIVSLNPGHRVVGFEALARWRHPLHGLLEPDEFVPLAEETGLITAIDARVLDQACRHLTTWIRSGHGDLQLSVNVSGRSFQDPGLAERVQEMLATTGMPVANLYLEITETVLVADIEATKQTVARLDQLGLRLAVDDFGTGYSSLRYLRRFPVAILKIDRSFVDGIGTDREDETIVGAVVGLARALGITVVAEGVETDLQADHLYNLGCAMAQGYHFGLPLMPAEAERLLPVPDSQRSLA
jgi:diguanylate cyclase (GGDEF)-like protein